MFCILVIIEVINWSSSFTNLLFDHFINDFVVHVRNMWILNMAGIPLYYYPASLHRHLQLGCPEKLFIALVALRGISSMLLWFI